MKRLVFTCQVIETILVIAMVVFAQINTNIGGNTTRGGGLASVVPVAGIDVNIFCPKSEVATYPGGVHFDDVAELPRTCINTLMANTPAPGPVKTICPASAGTCDFISMPAAFSAMTALGTGACGWDLQLKTFDQSGNRLTYTGTQTLPAISCDPQHWIWFGTDRRADLPPENGRVNPSYAGYGQIPGRPDYTIAPKIAMPKLVGVTVTGSGAAAPTLTIPAGANYMRIIGLNPTSAANTKTLGGIVSSANAGNHIIWDRNLIGSLDDTQGVLAGSCLSNSGAAVACTEEIGINMRGPYQAVQGSYIYNIRRQETLDADAKGIFMGNGSTGPFLIGNNFIEGGDENWFCGGGAATVPCSDAMIAYNQLWKPLMWKKNCTVATCGVAYNNFDFEAKNLGECKNCIRVLYWGNVAQHSWYGQSDQDGGAILWTPKNPNNTCPTCLVTDITQRFNIIDGANKAVEIAPVIATQGGTLPAEESRLSIHDELWIGIEYPTWYSKPPSGGYDALCMKFVTDMKNTAMFNTVHVNHVTCIQNGFTSTATGGFVNVTDSVVGSTLNNFWWRNSIAAGGFKGLGAGGGVGQCINSTGASYTTLTGCFGTVNWCADGNYHVTAAWPAEKPNSPYPNPVGSLGTQPSPGCPDPLVGNGSVASYATIIPGYLTGDYHVAPAYKGKGTDGKDPGADVDAVLLATSGVS